MDVLKTYPIHPKKTETLKKNLLFKGGSHSQANATTQTGIETPSLKALQANYLVRFGAKSTFPITVKIMDMVTTGDEKAQSVYPNVLTFQDFLDKVGENPRRLIRTSSQYRTDCIDHGNEEAGLKGNKIKVKGKEIQPMAFLTSDTEGEREGTFVGQKIFADAFYRRELQDGRKRHPNKIRHIAGPNGCGKSLFFRKLFRSLEDYSNTDDGVMYTFGIQIPKKVEEAQDASKSGNVPKGDEYAATFYADMNCNPIFLLNRQERQEMLDDLGKAGLIPPDFNRGYFLDEELDSRSQKVVSALTKAGWSRKKILDSVVVSRLRLSEARGKGLIRITPSILKDGLKQEQPQVNWDAMPSDIKDALQAENVHAHANAYSAANRGLLVFDDMGKDGDIKQLLELFDPSEERLLRVLSNGSVVLDALDVGMYSTINDETLLKMFETAPDLARSFAMRSEGLPIQKEGMTKPLIEKYQEYIDDHTRRPISHNVARALGRFTAMTALSRVNKDNPIYKERVEEADYEALQEALMTLYGEGYGVNFKTRLYDGDDLKLRSETHEMLLKKYVDVVADEYQKGVGVDNFVNYEGYAGLSLREGLGLADRFLAHSGEKPISVLQLFDYLEEASRTGMEYYTHYQRTVEELAELKHLIDSEYQQNHRVKGPRASGGGTVASGGGESLEDRNIGVGKAPVQKVQTVATPKVKHSFQYPLVTLEPPETLIEYTKRDIAQAIQEDVDTVLQSVLELADPATSHRETLQQYYYHVRAHYYKTGTSNDPAKEVVPKKWRVDSTNEHPDEEYMRHIENKFDIPDPRRADFRKDYIETIHSSDDPRYAIEHLDEIFPQHVQTLMGQKTLEEKQVEARTQFFADLKEYYRDESVRDAVAVLLNDGDPNEIIDAYRQEHQVPTHVIQVPMRYRRLGQIIEKLQSDDYGYHQDYLLKEVNFAFKDEMNKKTSEDET